MKVISYPNEWLNYKPIDEMKGKPLGVFAHCFVKNGEQDAIKQAYKKIVDVAIEEETCLVLSASQSLVMPNHNLLYEEWTDYDEFFEVQVKRAYRNAFYKWLDPIRSGSISAEFTNIFYSSGRHPVNIASQNAYVLVQSYQLKPTDYEKARQLLKEHIDAISQDERNIFANAHQSINNPDHFLLYEIWEDFSDLIETELHRNSRTNLHQQMNNAHHDENFKSRTELFQIYYDPDKYDLDEYQPQ